MGSLPSAQNILNLTEDELAVLTAEWDTSAALRVGASQSIPAFLTPAGAVGNLEFCSVSEEDRRTVLGALPTLLAEPDIVSLAIHLQHRVFSGQGSTADWPDVGDRSPMLGYLYLIVAASMAPLVRETHQGRGVPESVTRETCMQVAAFCGNHKVGHAGQPGLLPRQFYWLRHYPAGRLYRIGRFEYMVGEYHHAGPVYRHRTHGWALTLADPKAFYTPDGLEQCVAETPGAWMPQLSERDGRICGHPIDPAGVARTEPIELPSADWECVLKTGDPVLDLHIPAGGGMTLERATDSFTRSFDFFEDYVAEVSLKAIVCRSWIFNTQLEERIPDSNLADLMRQVYLLPARGSGRDGLFFVFCKEYDSLSDYPRETRMHRALLDVLETGGRLRTTGMVVLREDLHRLGTEPYRRDWAALTAAM